MEILKTVVDRDVPLVRIKSYSNTASEFFKKKSFFQDLHFFKFPHS